MDLKSFFHLDDKHKDDEEKKKEHEASKEKDDKEKKEFEGSGIFTTDGKELPKIPGGYDLVGPDSGLGDNEFD